MYEPTEVLPALIQDIRWLRLSCNQVSALSGVSAANISRAVNGQRDLPYPEYCRLRCVLDDLKQIQAQTPDRLLYWGDFRVTRRLIETLRIEREAEKVQQNSMEQAGSA